MDFRLPRSAEIETFLAMDAPTAEDGNVALRHALDLLEASDASPADYAAFERHILRALQGETIEYKREMVELTLEEVPSPAPFGPR